VDSLQTYKSRINRIVSDFTDYGADAKSMASWNPLSKQRKRAGTTKTNAKSVSSESNKSNKTMTGIHLEDSKPTELPDLQDIRLPLAGNRNVVIYYPMDLSEVEAEKIGTVLKGIAALSKMKRLRRSIVSNYAFIDSQNLNLGVRSLGWQVDYKKFRLYLKNKHGVDKAFMFIGLVGNNQRLYTHLQPQVLFLSSSRLFSTSRTENRL